MRTLICYRLYLDDDSSLDCDLAILADGGRSGLREQLGDLRATHALRPNSAD